MMRRIVDIDSEIAFASPPGDPQAIHLRISPCVTSSVLEAAWRAVVEVALFGAGLGFVLSNFIRVVAHLVLINKLVCQCWARTFCLLMNLFSIILESRLFGCSRRNVLLIL